jgi:hypothetical protein
MHQLKFKTKIRRDILEALNSVIETLIVKHPATDDDDKMLHSNLNEVAMKAKQKLLEYKTEYAFSLSPAQAFALRILYTNYILDCSTYLGNKLHQISNAVHKQYS